MAYKRGLVLEGGGAKGAFAFGALQVLHERGVNFDVVAGTSVGALNAALWATGSVTKGSHGDDLWTNISDANTYAQRLPVFLRLVIAPALILLSLQHYYGRASRNYFAPPFISNLEPYIRRIASYSVILAGLPGLIISALCMAADGPIIPSTALMVAILFVLIALAEKTAHATGLADFQTLFALVVCTIVMASTYMWNVAVPPVPPETGWSLLISSVLALGVILFAGLTGLTPTTRDSLPLAKTIDEVLRTRDIACPVYVTLGVCSYLFDPDDPTYETVAHSKGIIHSYYYTPVRYVPYYCKLNGKTKTEQRDALLASAALPFGIVPSVKIGNRECVDGGVIDNCPVFPLVSLAACDEILVIRLAPCESNEQLNLELMDQWKRVERYTRVITMQAAIHEEAKYFSSTTFTSGRRFKRSDPPVEFPYAVSQHP